MRGFFMALLGGRHLARVRLRRFAGAVRHF